MTKFSILRHFQSVMAVLLIALMSLSLTACGDDDDEPEGNSLKGTSWIITQSDDDEDLIGVQVTFNSDGNVKFTPTNDWTYAKWEQNDNTLKITLGEGEPDDYIKGNFVINGNSATYTYSWYDVNGKWGGEETYTMKLQKK